MKSKVRLDFAVTAWSRSLAAAAVSIGVGLGSCRAQASPVFPEAIAQAAKMPCVPTCTLCHTVNPGTATTWTSKQLPTALFATQKLVAGDAASFKVAYALYAADPNNAAHVAALAKGQDPATGTSVCIPQYGCGARLAKAPPPDVEAPAGIIAALALVVGFRRRKRAAGAV